MERWTKEQQILIDIGRREFKQEVVGIINGKFRKAFPDLAKQLVEEIEKK